jgi:UDP-N-acetylglucosamine 2-epimerase
MKKIASIVGARPQFVKLAPLSKKLRQNHREIIIHTGQHFDDNMSLALFRDLEIPQPDYFLDVRSGSHGMQTGRMLEKIESVLITEKPDLVVVFGDTNSTLAGALAAVKLQIAVLHIESGLRSYNRTMPEEINRIATDHIADYLFAPTEQSLQTLIREGLKEKSHLTGDIMVDVLRDNVIRAGSRLNLLESLQLIPDGFYLATLHRPYTVDNPVILGKVITSLGLLDQPVVFPVHPRTRKTIEENDISIPRNCITINPMGYLDFLCLESNCLKIITDSGGVQKEAYLLKKPCITLRPETEWIETVEEGWNLLVHPDADNIASQIQSFSPSHQQNDFLGTDVTERMVEIIDCM